MPRKSMITYMNRELYIQAAGEGKTLEGERRCPRWAQGRAAQPPRWAGLYIRRRQPSPIHMYTKLLLTKPNEICKKRQEKFEKTDWFRLSKTARFLRLTARFSRFLVKKAQLSSFEFLNLYSFSSNSINESYRPIILYNFSFDKILTYVQNS